MSVDREQYGEENTLVCPLPRCGHKWCKSCNKTVASSEDNHRCKHGNIDRLVRRKGWRYCPGKVDHCKPPAALHVCFRMYDACAKRIGLQPYDSKLRNLYFRSNSSEHKLFRSAEALLAMRKALLSLQYSSFAYVSPDISVINVGC